MSQAQFQIAIIGGGIAGLWILDRVRQLGFNACLLEQKALGSAQSLASQGMIHGGLKYALGGFTTPSSETIASMPNVWRDCLAGKGQVDLSGLKPLSDDYYLFSDAALSSKITAFFASKSLQGRIAAMDKKDYPELFQHKSFRGLVYQLQDLVLDTPALLQHLAQRHQDCVYEAKAKPILENGRIKGLDLGGGQTLTAEQYIFAAGSGNEALIKGTKLESVKMQLRPLQQVMVKGNLPRAYAHAVSLRDASKPRVTISSHPHSDGDMVWYLGGNVAEKGVGQNKADLISSAQKELSKLFSWLDFSSCQWDTLAVDRAEPLEKNFARPDAPHLSLADNLMLCWPTKLTLTPLLADEVIKGLNIKPNRQDPTPLNLAKAKVGLSPWEQSFV